MSRLDDIERRIDERMAEIDRRIGRIFGDSSPARTGGDADRAIRRASAGKDYIDWIKRGRPSSESRFGLDPEPFDFSYLANLSAGVASRREPRVFPVKFDLRSEGVVMPVRDQTPYGTCWAHGAVASLESSFWRRGEKVEFSVNNLVNLSGFDNGYFNPNVPGMPAGGTPTRSCAYFLRWDGPVFAKDDPYGRPGASRHLPPVAHVQDVRFIPPMKNASDTGGIKSSVIDIGAVAVPYMHMDDALDNRTGGYYNPSEKGNGHLVAIIGWDDAYPVSSFSTPPPGPGAWIVRNSWGVNWGDGGYFYVSYHDATFGKVKQYPMCVYHGVERTENYDDVLQYDMLGLIGKVNLGQSETCVAANVFPAYQDLTVVAVGFYALVPGTSYGVRIYSGCTPDNPASGHEDGATEGILDWPGFHTVRLASPVRVSAGSRFSIVMKLNTPGLSYPIPVEFADRSMGASKAEAAPGQSFIYDGVKWVDMFSKNATMNICCKAYVKFTGDGERSHRMFCKACGKYSYVERYGNNKCPHCGAWLD